MDRRRWISLYHLNSEQTVPLIEHPPAYHSVILKDEGSYLGVKNTRHNSANATASHYWVNGEWMDRSGAKVSVFDHGLLYGDGCFEGLRFYNCTPFRLGQHLARLERSAKALSLELPYSLKEMDDAICECITRSGLINGYIRLVVTRGEGDLGLDPRKCARPTVVIIPAELDLVGDDQRNAGIKLATSSVRRTVGSGLDPRVKSLNYLHSILARIEAIASGADEAILLNQNGFVVECSAENLFIVRGGKVFTPPLSDGPRAGITRETILELCAGIPLDVVEEPMTTYDLYNADECFLCGTGARLIPVRSIDGREIRKVAGPVFSSLAGAFRSLVDSECPAG